MRPQIRAQAQGRWLGILPHFGVERRYLRNIHGPCPCCGGRDRFRFDDREGNGTFFCSGCGSGDGFDLIAKVTGLEFRRIAEEVRKVVDAVPVQEARPTRTPEQTIAYLRQMWNESVALKRGDPVDEYLTNRGIRLEKFPQVLRFHPRMPYSEDGKTIGYFHAMLAKVVNPQGESIALHRTYISDGQKAPVPSPKKIIGKSANGPQIRLRMPSDGFVLLAEGIETALAAELYLDARDGCGVVACISATGMQGFQVGNLISESCKPVITICADYDESFTGQHAAFVLAKRLHENGVLVDVQMPDDGDFNDMLLRERQR